MKYFIAGGAGFIGSHFAETLAPGNDITAYDNLSSGRIEHLSNLDVHLITGDVNDLNALCEAMEGADVVVHFASNPDISRGMTETDLDIREGTLLTYNIVEAMRRTGVRQLLYASGSGVYGEAGEVYTPEDYGPLLPISLYGASKLACEGLISAFCSQFDLQAWMFRFANVVGRRQTHGVAFDFIRRLKEDPSTLTILGDGAQSKPYIHVSDVIAAMCHLREHCHTSVDVFNVATPDSITVTEIADMVVEEMGLSDVQYQYTGGNRGWKGDVPIVRLETAKAQALGWRPALDSRQAVHRSICEMLSTCAPVWK